MNRVEDLVRDVESLDAVAREGARAIVRSVLDLHREGLERLLALAAGSREAFASDRRVAGRALLSGLHPHPALERARRALAGTGAELLPSDPGVVRVRAPARVRGRVEELLLGAAPDADRIEIEVVPEPEDLVPVG